MSAYVVWMDFKEAKVFKLAAGQKPELAHLKAHGGKHHNEGHGNHHPEAAPFFNDAMKALTDASEILLLGPGEGKNAFKKHMEAHQKNLAAKVVGVEAVDHPTDNQIMEKARKFFQNYDLFH